MTGQVTIRGRAGRDLVAGPDRQRIMGVLNVTPDSFSGDGGYTSAGAAVDAALRMEEDGADVLDIGGESSRPGSDRVGEAVERSRVLPVLEKLRPRTRLPISVDTTKAAVARAALEAGADWINDISALRADPEMAAVVAASGAAVVLMHMQGEPRSMQASPRYDDTVREVADSLAAWADNAVRAGIDRGQILVDPGIGFGKRLEHNVALLRGLATLRELGLPVLLGASRKSFLGSLLATADGVRPPPAQRDAATVAVLAIAHAAGVSVHRVHNVRYARDALRTLDGIGRAGAGRVPDSPFRAGFRTGPPPAPI